MIRWHKIRERFAYGYRAVLGTRGVEVYRTDGRWHVFPQRDGRTVWCGAAPDYQRDRHDFRTFSGAKRAATDYLRTGRYFGTDLDALPLAK